MTPTPPTPTQMQRLAFAKYLLWAARQQQTKVEPLGAASVLSLHDAVETLNFLVAEALGTDATQFTFMAYWEQLGLALTEKGSMSRLNSARKELKHRGTIPSTFTLREFVEAGERYFRATVLAVFGIPVEAISLISFVECTAVQTHLQAAAELCAQAEVEKGLIEAAAAFADLMHDFDQRTRDRMQRPLLGEPISWSLPSDARRELGGTKTGRFVGEVAKKLDSLHEITTLLACGIDVRDHAHFKRLTPHVARMMAGNLQFTWSYSSPSTRVEDLEFCVQFVLESALRVQEFSEPGTHRERRTSDSLGTT